MRSPLGCKVDQERFKKILKGKVEDKFLDKFLHRLRYSNFDVWRLYAEYEKMKFSDYLIVKFSDRVKNNKLNRKIYKDKIVKKYEDTDKYLFVMEDK